MDPYNVIYPDEIDGGESAFFPLGELRFAAIFIFAAP